MADTKTNVPAHRERDLDIFQEDDFFPIGSLFGGSPWQSLRRIHDEMDAVFGRLLGSGFRGPTIQAWEPSTDISEDKSGWRIEVDLPGVKKDDIDVHVDQRQLSIRAEMRQETETGDKKDDEHGRQYHRRERRYGHFERTMTLPDNVKEEDIKCDFKDGVLSVCIPKAQTQEPGGRKIPVSSEPSTNGHN
ncbi:MAG: Hsp20/alpha crystallin family protein [Armatimonadetes bacterium]|nr:Hsp20/alpha crystallin family protein [Armatimonadota bacterium]